MIQGYRLQWQACQKKNSLFTENIRVGLLWIKLLNQTYKIKYLKIKNKEHLLAIFMDFERAVYKSPIPTLLIKLQKLRIIGNTANWIENYKPI